MNLQRLRTVCWRTAVVFGGFLVCRGYSCCDALLFRRPPSSMICARSCAGRIELWRRVDIVRPFASWRQTTEFFQTSFGESPELSAVSDPEIDVRLGGEVGEECIPKRKFQFPGFSVSSGKIIADTDFIQRTPPALATYEVLSISDFWIIGLALLFFAPRLFRLVRVYFRRRRNRCLACGYDLRASEERCPECGREIQRSERARFNTSPQRKLTG